MSDQVFVPEASEDNAVLLLAAAEKLDQDAGVVRTGDGGFYVPKDVADEAGVDYEGSDGALDFKTRGDAEAYADKHDIEIDGASGMKADEYKQAVADAARAKGE